MVLSLGRVNCTYDKPVAGAGVIPKAGTELKWHHVDGRTEQAWAVRELVTPGSLREGVIELWVREADDQPGEVIYLTRSNAQFLARVLGSF